MSNTTHVIRVDASSLIGGGHFMRMIALGQMLKDKGREVHFVTATQTGRMLERIKLEGFILHRLADHNKSDASRDADGMLKIANDIRAEWVVLDGRQFKTDYQHIIKEKGFKLMCISDSPLCHSVADVVLNQNINATTAGYSSKLYTKFYIGPKYALLRREFITAKLGFKRDKAKKIKRILVTMGASNFNRITQKVLEALNGLSDSRLQIKAVMGPLASHNHNIYERAKSARNQIELIDCIGPEMPGLMKWADLGVFAGGSAVLEGQYLDLPMICCQLSDDQKANYVPSFAYDEDLYGRVLSVLNSTADFYVMKKVDVSPFDVSVIL